MLRELWDRRRLLKTIGLTSLSTYPKSLPNKGTGTGFELEWVFEVPGGVIGRSPVVDRDAVYVESVEGVHCISRGSGLEQWCFDEVSQGVGSPVIDQDLVYVPGMDSNIYGLDKVTGSVEWVFTSARNPAKVSPSVKKGRVYIGVENGRFYALDKATGEHRWCYRHFSQVETWSTATIHENQVYLGTGTPGFMALKTETGGRLWNYNHYTDNGEIPLFLQPGTVSHGNVYTCSNANELICLDKETGEEQWIVSNPIKSIGSPPTVHKNTVYLACPNGELFAFNAHTGEQRWVFKHDQTLGTPTIIDQHLFVGSGNQSNGAIHRLDTETGTQNKIFEQPESLIYKTLIANGTLYFGTEKGQFYAVNTELNKSSQDTITQQQTHGQILQ